MNEDMPLGSETPYPDKYSPELLYEVPRARYREALGIRPDTELPFHGVDIWNAWELTWLDSAGMPRNATAEIRVPAESPKLIESKSLKLYLNSFAMTRYASTEDVAEIIEQELSSCAGADVDVVLRSTATTEGVRISRLPGDSLDGLRIRCASGSVDPALLRVDAGEVVTETLHTHLLRSLCPVTQQPDSGSVLVSYRGARIDRESLLRYIVSFRRHAEFHEACVERMFVEIRERCVPERLTVYARYQRRGGIDINPFRSDFEDEAPNLRLWQQ